MLFCPNPECPYIKEIGKPAEYVEGVTHCSDCGNPLTGEEISSEEEKKRITLNSFHKRLLYTLWVLVLWRLFAHVNAPGIDFSALDKLLVGTGGASLFLLPISRTSIFTFGLMPYITAYVAVEILALLITPLKSWRAGGYQGRVKL